MADESVDAWAVVEELTRRLAALGWVRDVLVAGSLATGDYVPAVSDLDLVAITDGPVDDDRLRTLTDVHSELDRGLAAGLDLGCVYVDDQQIDDHSPRHPTWTHGRLVHRSLSGITRVELALHGRTTLGRAPLDVVPPAAPGDVRAAAQAELDGYWRWAARRPWLWFSPMIADLGLTAMARGRHAIVTGQLLTKTAAIEEARAPQWLRAQLRARRKGGDVRSPRLPTALIAWVDACRTVGIRQLIAPPRR